MTLRKYEDFVNGGEGFKMVMKLKRGRDASISPLFMVFRNWKGHYPIRGVPENVPGVSYRTVPK